MTDAQRIVGFVRNELLEEDAEIATETSLFRDQLLNSMSLPRLIAFLEDDFGIKVGALDVIYENLDSADLMVAYIDRKRSEDAN